MFVYIIRAAGTNVYKEFDTAMRVAIFGEMHSGEQR